MNLTPEFAWIVNAFDSSRQTRMQVGIIREINDKQKNQGYFFVKVTQHKVELHLICHEVQ